MRYERVAMLAVVTTFGVWAAMCKSSDSPPPPPPAPTVDVGTDVRATTGQAVSLTARIAAPGASPGSYRWTLAWGDASVDSGDVGSTGTITVSHTYAAVGQYALSLTGRASTGTTDNDTATVYVDAPGTPQVFIGAGDIGECDKVHSVKTAAVIDTIAGTVFTLGDNAYPNGQPGDFTRTDGPGCWANTWGRFKKRIHPTPGNHEYALRDTTAAGYFGYFGVAAHEQPTGWYSYDVGAWHIIVLNSNFLESQALGRVLKMDTQLAWLSADLAAHPAACTLAMWHHPHFSSGPTHGAHLEETQPTKPFWDTLYAHGADVILSGHEHNYERFAPQTPDSVADPVNGIREFVAGIGGGGYDTLATTTRANSEVSTTEHGVLKLTLTPGFYHWEFIPTSGPLGELDPSTFTFTDSGTASCH
ncbi:MAG TPA: metallophosphoesterase [Gemmatimonadales bacterium]